MPFLDRNFISPPSKTTRSIALLIILAGILAVLAPAQDRPHSPAFAATQPAAKLGFVKGYTWGWWGTRGSYLGDAPAESMKRLAADHVEFATIAFVAHMPAHNIPMIAWSTADPRMVSDDEIRRAIDLARQNHVKVILKPVFDCLDGVPRSDIDFKTKDGQPDIKAWDLWWECYESFLLHYAEIAQKQKCESLVIGCELTSTEKFEDHWRALIPKIRKIYTGPIIYNTAHLREMDVTWWDAVDVIGVGVYYTVGTENDYSLPTMLKAFEVHRDRLKQLSKKWNRPILFAEIGCRSSTGSQVWPGDSTHWEWPANGKVQANFYEAALQCFWDEPWFTGYCWWDWPATLYDKSQAATDKQFYIYGKPAEEILRTWYAKDRKAK